jgi:hypothetical protein
MKRIIFLAALVVAALSMSAVAFAGNGSTTSQFKAAYSFGDASALCSGVNVYKAAPKLSNTDSETCQLSNPTGYFAIGTAT